MTEVKCRKKGNSIIFSAVGHAGDSTVCTAVSILCYQLAQIVTDAYGKKNLKCMPSITLEDGNVHVRCDPRQHSAYEMTIVFDSVMRGFEILAKNYPNNVTVK